MLDAFCPVMQPLASPPAPGDVVALFRDRTVFVTGATGFIGSHVASHLVASGARVRALFRPRVGRIPPTVEGLEWIPGDLLDPTSLDAAFRGADFAFHVAADYRLWARSPREIYESNVTGTANFLAAATRSNIRRVIYTGTIGVLTRHPDGTPATETELASEAECARYGPYKHSKLLAQIEVEKSAANGMDIVSVLPTTPVGEGDLRPTPTGRLIVEFLNGRIPLLSRTGLNLVDVRIAALGHLLAAARAAAGERYLLSGANLWLAEIFTLLEPHTTARRPPHYCPHWLARISAVASEALAFTGAIHEPFATREAVRLSKGATFCSGSKAASDLGLPSSDIPDALARAASWFASQGMIRI